MKCRFLTLVLVFISLFLASCGRAKHSSFSPSQKQEIGEIASQYFLDHPDTLLKVSQKLDIERQEKKQRQAIDCIAKNSKSLIHPSIPQMIGNKNSKIILIEFYDYQCIYCHKEHAIIRKILKSDNNILYIAKQYPIFSSRWPASEYAAKVSLLSAEQSKFEAYDNGLFQSNAVEGKLTNDIVDNIASNLRIDTTIIKNKTANPIIDEEIKNNKKLAEAIGIKGTPGIIVMSNSKNPTIKNTRVFFGFVTMKELSEAIHKYE